MTTVMPRTHLLPCKVVHADGIMVIRVPWLPHQIHIFAEMGYATTFRRTAECGLMSATLVRGFQRTCKHHVIRKGDGGVCNVGI